MGTETSLVEGDVINGGIEDVGSLVMQLAEKLAVHLREAGPRLVGSDAAEVDPVPALKDQGWPR